MTENSNTERKTLVVNLFAGPGAGKTTCAWLIAAELKKLGFVAEYVPEYAKELVWDGSPLLDGRYENQRTITDEQNRRIQRLIGKVDIVVTDSPPLLSTMYIQERRDDYEQYALALHKQYNSFNLVIKRGEGFEQEGRIHSYEQSIAIDSDIKALLDKDGIFYGTYTHDNLGVVVSNIRTTLEKLQGKEQRKPDIKQERPVQPHGAPNRVTSEQIEKARQMSALEYLQRYEQTELVKNGSSEYRLKSNRSVAFTASNGKFYDHATGEGGYTALDFLIKIRGVGFIDAVRQLAGQEAGIKREGVRHTQPPPPEPGVLPPLALPPQHMGLGDKPDNRRAFAYLRSRGIDAEVINHHIKRGALYEESEHHNAVFVGKDKDGAARYASLRGTISTGRYVGEVAGSSKQYAWNDAGTKPGTLHVFESVIDAMSAQTMMKLGGKTDWREQSVLSLGGVAMPEGALPASLEHYLSEHPGVKQIYLSLDNDEPGKAATDKLKQLLEARGYSVAVREVKLGKDINDELQARVERGDYKKRRPKETSEPEK